MGNVQDTKILRVACYIFVLQKVKQKPLEISYKNRIVKSTIVITPYQMLKHQR